VRRGEDRPGLVLRLAGSADPVPPVLRPPDPSVDVWRDNAGEVCAYTYSAGGWHCMDWPAVARFCFDQAADAVVAWVRPGVAWPAVERVHRRGVVPAALQRLGFETLHASAVRLPAGVVGFLGHAGAGKSTLARAFGSAAGADPWSDDTLVLDFGGDDVAAVPIPFDVGLRPPSVQHFGNGSSGVVVAGGGRAPLRALMMLDRGSARISVTPLGARDALDALLPHACTFSMKDAARRRQMVEHYLTLAARAHVFRLAYPTDFGALPGVLEIVTATVAGRGTGAARLTRGEA
jgi:hypothetical protein